LETVAPAATACQLMDASNGNGSSVPVDSAEVPVRDSVVDNDLLARVYSRGFADLLDGPAQRPQVGHCQLQGRLLRLVGGADHVVDAGLRVISMWPPSRWPTGWSAAKASSRSTVAVGVQQQLVAGFRWLRGSAAAGGAWAAG
jgi:hypothetical protein